MRVSASSPSIKRCTIKLEVELSLPKTGPNTPTGFTNESSSEPLRWP
ncbi:MAG TPA: hypothetical protein VHV51_14925 [Polyangiaceae bacterium]|nr:hypothetical protein [Polyangiaceae bacterium]